MTYLVCGRSDLGGRQQDLELVDAKVADADAPATVANGLALVISNRTTIVATGQDRLKALTWRDLLALWLPSLPKPSEYQVVRGVGGG